MSAVAFTAHLDENRTLGRGAFVLVLRDCEALVEAEPGQFVMLRGDWGRDPLLPRAFSLLSVRDGGGCEILVKAIGRATRLLEHLAPRARLALLGPLGRPFPAPRPDRLELLVAGGVGLAPLLWQARRAARAGAACELFYGARSAGDLVLRDEIERAACQLSLTTEDGTLGRRGRVTDALAERLARGAAGARILTCGPNPMMQAVVELALQHGLECHVSVEGEMACGVGVCLGCAVPVADGSRPFAYACIDGPVFDARTIVIP